MNAYGAGFAVRHPTVDRGARAFRAPPTRAPAIGLRIRFGPFDLDEDNARLLCDGKPLDLPPRPFEVLCALARRPGSLVTKNELLDEVWGHRFVSESVLKTVVGKLRTALQDDARNPRFIETVQRRGYRFIAAEGAGEDPCEAGPAFGHRQPHAPAISLERVLREIREVLLLVSEQPHERHRAAARIVDTIGRWAGTTAGEGSMLFAQGAVEAGPSLDRKPTVR